MSHVVLVIIDSPVHVHMNNSPTVPVNIMPWLSFVLLSGVQTSGSFIASELQTDFLLDLESFFCAFK